MTPMGAIQGNNEQGEEERVREKGKEAEAEEVMSQKRLTEVEKS